MNEFAFLFDTNPKLVESWWLPIEGEHYFRIENTSSPNELYLTAKKVLRRTPKGLWVDDYGVEKFINNSHKKQFAHPTKELAMKAYIARRKRQVEILSAQLTGVEKQLQTAKILLEQGL